jgi:hypothetical protein
MRISSESMINSLKQLSLAMLFVTFTYGCEEAEAIEFNVSSTSNTIEVVSDNNKQSFVLRPESSKVIEKVEDQASLPEGYKYNIGAGSFNDLQPQTMYFLDQYVDGVLVDTEKISTLAMKPKEPAGSIVFAGQFMEKIAVGLNNKDAENALIIVSQNSLSQEQLQRTDFAAIRKILSDRNFKAGYNERGAKLAENSYIVYAGEYSSPSVIEIPVPEYNEYTFAVIGYNGEGAAANFNVEPASNNIRKKFPMMPPPIAVDPTEWNMEDGYFMAKWKQLPVEANYVISVATDPDFKNVLAEYHEIDFGNLDQAPVMYEGNDRLYYRVRAVQGRNKSGWSNSVSVDLDK